MKISMPDDIKGIPDGCPSKTYAERRDRLRGSMRERGLDALVVSQPANRFYLSGFELHDPQPNESSGLLVICATGEDWLLTDSRYELAAKEIWPQERVLIYRSQLDTLAQCLTRNANLAGLELETQSWAYINKLRVLLGRHVFITSADGLVEKQREIKDSWEIEALRKSFHLNHQMFEWLDQKILKNSLEKMSEGEVAWEIERLFRERGAQELAFDTIVATGKNSARPHAIPGADKCGRGAPLLVDAGCRVDNYCSDQSRTWWIGGDPSSGFVKSMDLVREAQQAAMDIMRPGVECKAVYAAARKVFEEAGVASAFTHSLGHGVGLETHEGPRLSSSSKDILEKDMAVTVEPGLYYPEWGGIRWEYTVLVTDEGVEIL